MPSLYALAGTARLLAAETIADINDATQLAQSLQSAAPEVVFHLAAQPLVRESYARPVETFATNVMGTAHLLEAVRRAPSVRAVIVVTTDKCYENREWVWGYRETDALGGHDPYSASKAAAEILTSAWRASFFSTGASIVTARAGNVIGGGDFARDRLLPDFVRAIEHEHDLEIRNPHAVRPWQFVLDPLQGYLEPPSAHMPGKADSTAHGTSGRTNPARARSARSSGGSPTRARHGRRIAFGAIQPQPHEATLLKLDTSKARAHLAWRPRLDLRETLEWTANWYRSYLAGADMHALTRMQLDQYMARRADC